MNLDACVCVNEQIDGLKMFMHACTNIKNTFIGVCVCAYVLCTYSTYMYIYIMYMYVCAYLSNSAYMYGYITFVVHVCIYILHMYNAYMYTHIVCV